MSAETMSTEKKKGYGSMLLLLLLGVVALFMGDRSLIVVIPAAIVIWYGARPTLGNDRN